MSDAIAQLLRLPREHQTAILSRLRDRVGVTTAPGAATIAPRARTGAPMPASYLQEQLFFLDLVCPGTPAYHIPFRFRLRGRLDTGALHAALAEIARRHEILRTRLALRGGRVVQVIGGDVPVELPVIDLAGVPADRREAAADAFAREAAHAAFDLGTGPLVRTRLIRLAEEHHVLVWIAHHTVADGQSARVFLGELAACYPASAAGRAPDLPEPALQYGDYALWQRDRLIGPHLDRLLDFWRDRLAGVAPLELPVDKPRPAVADFAGAVHRFAVSAPLTAALRELSRRHGATLFMLMQAVYRILLAGWTGARDICVGTSTAGRELPEVATMIGPLLNVVAIRTGVGDDMTVGDLLERVRTATVDAMAHQELPFGQLVKHLAPSRDPGRNPIFQTMFDLGGSGIEGAESRLGPDLRLAASSILLDVSQVDLAVVIDEVGDGLAGRFEYRTGLFRPGTVRRLDEAYRALLAAVVRDPDATVASLIQLSAPPTPRRGQQ